MHEKLKFSFGHIIAFLALLAIGYVIFMSVTYYTRGNYIIGGAIALPIMVVLLLLLFRLQLLKAVNVNFEKKIIHERITLVLFIIACCASFVVFTHFWTVKINEDEIHSRFDFAMNTSEQLFADYEHYVNNRKSIYSSTLESEENSDSLSNIVLRKGLELQLTPPRYKNLYDEATKWLTKSKKNFSVWNVFLIGNIDNICSSMESWSEMMTRLSQHKMNAESLSVQPFVKKTEIDAATEKLKETISIYSTTGFPQPMAWVSGLTFLLLFLPWLIQKRSPRSMVTIWGKRKIKTSQQRRTQQLDTNERIAVERHANTLNDDNRHIASVHRAQNLNTGNSVQTGHRAMTLDIDEEEE
ncbi:MAG: hypothetical protein J6X58_03070 [Bacteroidales bacterium]|nr:hypothetical protein [Bacteroidales bacterium]